MEVFGPFLDGYANVHIQLWELLRERTFAALDEHTRRKAAMTRPEEVYERAKIIRETFLASIGGLPERDCPPEAASYRPAADLNPQVLGRVRRNGYAIEKIVFESQRSVYVTALLYLPEHRDRPAPGILFVSGHHREAKGNPEYQRVCHDLVTNGFVVLAVDPTGQGERVTHPEGGFLPSSRRLDPETGTMALEWGTTEHSFQGQQCILTGTSLARYFLFDAMRGIDYLQSRPEVDAELIGVTGNSGGGTQTSLLCMSGDGRIKAAAPCTYVTSRDHYYLTGQPQDAEQLQFGMTRNGINFDDFFIPFAPRPLLIGAVASDFFNPEGTVLTYERLRRIYGLLGCEDRVQLAFAPGAHMYHRDLRQAAVNWFRRHLLEREPDFVTRDDAEIETLPDADLWCTSKGHVLTDFPGARTPHHLNLERIPHRRLSDNPQELRSRVIETLRIRDRLDSLAPLYPRTTRQQEEGGIRADSIFFCSEPGIMAAGCLLRGIESRPERATIFLAENGTLQIDAHRDACRDLVANGEAAFVFDVRGTGSVKCHPVNESGETFPQTFYNTEAMMWWSAYCLGDCLLGMRVFDALRAAQYLREEAGFSEINLRAEGVQPALWGYLAAALDSGIGHTRVRGLIESFESIARTPLYRRDFTPPMLVDGVLREFDLPDLRLLFQGRALELIP